MPELFIISVKNEFPQEYNNNNTTGYNFHGSQHYLLFCILGPWRVSTDEPSMVRTS